MLARLLAVGRDGGCGRFRRIFDAHRLFQLLKAVAAQRLGQQLLLHLQLGVQAVIAQLSLPAAFQTVRGGELGSCFLRCSRFFGRGNHWRNRLVDLLHLVLAVFLLLLQLLAL